MKKYKNQIILMLFIFLWILPGCGTFQSRDNWQEPDRIIGELGLQPGMSAAEIGAGKGYFSFHFIRAVGPSGHVFAVDIDDEMIRFLNEKRTEQQIANLTVIRGTDSDSKLADNSADVIFLCFTYHHIGRRVEYFSSLKSKLKPGGRLGIVELMPDSLFGQAGSHAMERVTVVRELEQAGYILEKSPVFLSRKYYGILAQNFLVFKVRSPQ